MRSEPPAVSSYPKKSTTSAGPVIERPAGLIYAVDEWPPRTKLFLLGLQYAIMSAIYLVLVAIILRHANVAQADAVGLMALACAGLAIGTVLQSLPRGPVGSGFLAPPVFSAIFLAPSVLAAKVGGMPLVFGMTLFAGVVEFAVGLLLERLRLVITPVLSGLTVFVVGLELGVVGIGETLDVQHQGMPAFPLHLAVASITLLFPIGLSIWGRGTLKLLCTLFGLTLGMVCAVSAGLIVPASLAALTHAPSFTVPKPLILHVSFNLGLMPAFLAAGVAAALRTVGVITTCQQINNAAWKHPDLRNIRKGVLADALANVFGPILGVPGMSTGPSLVGMSGATGATSRVIGFATAAILLAFAFLPKVSGFFLLIPQEVAGSLLVFTACFMISGGMQIMLSRGADTRAAYVIGISTLLALSESIFPAYFKDLPKSMRSITGSPLALSLSAAVVLSLLFRFGTRQTARTVWNDSSDAVEAAITFLKTKLQSWKLPPNVLDTAAKHAREALEYISGQHSHRLEGDLDASYNGLELRLAIRYHGSPTTQLPSPRVPQIAKVNDLEDEEAAAYLGLRSFVEGLAVDRHQVKAKSQNVTVNLFYSI